jgi:hypothetical protein
MAALSLSLSLSLSGQNQEVLEAATKKYQEASLLSLQAALIDPKAAIALEMASICEDTVSSTLPEMERFKMFWKSKTL